MAYLDLGYDNFFNKSVVSPPNIIPNIDIDTLFEGFSGESILSEGSITSISKRMSMNLGKDNFIFNDGTVERVRLGQMDDGSYGLIIKDQDGNVIFNMTGTSNLIQSANQKMQLDFTKEQARWYDDKNLKIGIGKFQGLF